MTPSLPSSRSVLFPKLFQLLHLQMGSNATFILAERIDPGGQDEYADGVIFLQSLHFAICIYFKMIQAFILNDLQVLKYVNTEQSYLIGIMCKFGLETSFLRNSITLSTILSV